MPDTPVEKQGPAEYNHEMETRVAILEHSTAELKFEIREIKAMVRDLATEMREGFRAINLKFDATDKSIADLRVEVQSVRTELQIGLNLNLRWTVGTILAFGVLGIAIVGLIIKLH